MYNELTKIKTSASVLLNSDGKGDDELRKISILFPLFEALGYDTINEGDIVINPKIGSDPPYTFDYGLRDVQDGSIKTYIRVVPFQSALNRELAAINKVSADNVADKYMIITDCYQFGIYQNNQVEWDDVLEFDISKDLTSDEVNGIALLRNPVPAAAATTPVEDVADEVDMDDSFERGEAMEGSDEALPPVEPYVYKPSMEASEKQEKKEREHLVDVKKILAACIICFGLIVLVAGIVVGIMYVNNPENWTSIDAVVSKESLDYYTVSGTLSASAYDTKLSVIKVSFSNSNVPEGSIITFVVTNDAAKTSVTHQIAYSGVITEDISIPDGWTDCDITVTATLQFDSKQTASCKEMFGSNGENIIARDGYNKGDIASATLFYDSTAIKERIDKMNAEQAEKELAENREYLSNFNIVKTTNGDIWFYPAGYSSDDQDLNNPNITAEKQSYASICYNTKTNRAQFYYIAGANMGNKHVSFSSIAGAVILSDGINSYTLATNTGVVNFFINEYDSVSGWCRYDLDSVSNLFSILRTVYSASQPTIEFKGIIREDYISNADKKAVVSIMNLWLKYFNKETIVFNTEWIP